MVALFEIVTFYQSTSVVDLSKSTHSTSTLLFEDPGSATKSKSSNKATPSFTFKEKVPQISTSSLTSLTYMLFTEVATWF